MSPVSPNRNPACTLPFPTTPLPPAGVGAAAEFRQRLRLVQRNVISPLVRLRVIQVPRRPEFGNNQLNRCPRRCRVEQFGIGCHKRRCSSCTRWAHGVDRMTWTASRDKCLKGQVNDPRLEALADGAESRPNRSVRHTERASSPKSRTAVLMPTQSQLLDIQASARQRKRSVFPGDSHGLLLFRSHEYVPRSVPVH